MKYSCLTSFKYLDIRSTFTLATCRTGFLPGILFRGAKSIVMQISFVMLIFLLFSDQISGGKSPRGVNCPPPVEESQHKTNDFNTYTIIVFNTYCYLDNIRNEIRSKHKSQ